MKFTNLKSKLGVTNLFSDFILKKFGVESNTIIKVTCFENFFVINGTTNSTKEFNLSEIKSEFVKEFKEYIIESGFNENFGCLDMIKYQKEMTNNDYNRFWFSFFKSKRPIYHPEVIKNISLIKNYISLDYDSSIKFELESIKENIKYRFELSPLQITSEFPYGFSYPMGRALLYYSEYVCNQIFNTVKSDKIDLCVSFKKSDNDVKLNIKLKSIYPKLNIKSMVLDVFDFDYNEFYEIIESYDVLEDMINPIEDKPWLLKDKNPIDLIIF